jgi:Concanavalin A-like lectin/glucanases superfamily/Right handed beta helix region
MKKTLLFSLFFTSFLVKAQIASYNDAAQNTFNGIGGYSFSQVFFTGGVQGNPYKVSGPSPQNDFNFTASAEGGIQNVYTHISTQNVNKSILFEFKGNNVKKFGCRATAINIPTGQSTNEVIIFQANTNLGGIAAETVSATGFIGFNVTGGENVYIVSVLARFQSPSTNSIGINNIIIGDNTPQNVSLNFDGINDFVSTNGNVGNFATNQDFTVSCWIKPDPFQTTQIGQNPDENDIISKWAGLGAGVNNNYPFVIRYLNTTRTTVSERGKILVGQWDGTTFTTLISTTAVNDGHWHHVAFVRESGIFKLYINGNLEGSVADNVNNATNNTTPLQFGRRGNNESYFKGEIDEVRIWNIAKTQAEIQTNRFCKDPDSNFMAASYNGSNGVPHGNNALITQLPDVIGGNNGTLNNFAKTGDASNFVTGQVKYVNAFAAFGNNNGSSWTNAFTNLQSALTANTCNDLFDVYVAKGSYKPAISDDNITFNIPTVMRIYGGFAGIEKSINLRNMALIHNTNTTTLTGDLVGDDSPFDFILNRNDNSYNIVNITGSKVVFDGFTVKGAYQNGINISGTNTIIKNSRIIDNFFRGLAFEGDLATIANCSILGNYDSGISLFNSSGIIKENLIANNGFVGVFIITNNGTRQTTITSNTIVSNTNYGIRVDATNSSSSTNILKNTLIYGNATGGISNFNGGGTITNTITYSLVQGDAGGTNGNLNGNTVNPQFVSPLANNVISDLGDYRLKDSSPCINVGTDDGVSPLDLDRNPRPKGGKTDMGAYESNVNMNEIISIATGNWESNSTWNLERVPLATDKVILNNHTVTVTTNTAKAKIIEQKPSSDLKFNVGGSLELNQ